MQSCTLVATVAGIKVLLLKPLRSICIHMDASVHSHTYGCISCSFTSHPLALTQVVSRMESADHWITYCEVVDGAVLDPQARTAVHRRKVATFY